MSPRVQIFFHLQEECLSKNWFKNIKMGIILIMELIENQKIQKNIKKYF